MCSISHLNRWFDFRYSRSHMDPHSLLPSHLQCSVSIALPSLTVSCMAVPSCLLIPIDRFSFAIPTCRLRLVVDAISVHSSSVHSSPSATSNSPSFNHQLSVMTSDTSTRDVRKTCLIARRISFLDKILFKWPWTCPLNLTSFFLAGLIQRTRAGHRTPLSD